MLFVRAACLAQVSPSLYVFTVIRRNETLSHSNLQIKHSSCLVSDNAIGIQLDCSGFNFVQDGKRQRYCGRHC